MKQLSSLKSAVICVLVMVAFFVAFSVMAQCSDPGKSPTKKTDSPNGSQYTDMSQCVIDTRVVAGNNCSGSCTVFTQNSTYKYYVCVTPPAYQSAVGCDRPTSPFAG